MSHGAENRAKVEQIRAEYLNGYITLEEAKIQIQPILDDINKRGAAVAKKFGKKFRPLTFGYIFR